MMNLSFLKEKKLRLILHLVAITILFLLPIYIVNYKDNLNVFFIKILYLRTSIYVFLFYVNYLWLLPLFLFRKKIVLYFVSLILLLSTLFVISTKGHEMLINKLRESTENKEMPRGEPNKTAAPPDKREKKFEKPGPPVKYLLYDFILNAFLVTGLSAGLVVSQKLIKNEKEKKELEKEKLDSELALLKNQIGPHFFFNTLNSIYSLIQINAEDAQKSVLNLSKLMRYLLYETKQEKIQLYKEIEFMHNYIELMKLRLTSNVNLTVLLPENKPENMIPPLLFISFIENAFKHGISNRERSFIKIILEVKEKSVIFSCQNSITQKGLSMDNDHGIGLENIRKRLNLLFPENHKLVIEKTETDFQVFLKLEKVG